MNKELNNSLAKIDSTSLQVAMNQIASTNKILANIAEKRPKEYFEKGEYYFDKQQYLEAIEWYTKAIDLKPDFVVAYCKRGYSKSLMKDYNNAISDFSTSLKLKPDYEDAYL